MRKILSIFRKDYTFALRDNMMLYMFIAPIILCVVMSLFIPNLESTGVSLAVDASSVPDKFTNELKNYASVYVAPSYEKMEKKVLQIDDTPGIIFDGEKYKIIFEGNEAKETIEITGIIVNRIAYGKPLIETEVISLNIKQSNTREYMAVTMILTCILLAGLVLGFTIIEEKDSKAIHALAVSPLKMSEFITGKSLIAVIYSVLLGTISAFIILGTSFNLIFMIISILACSLFGILFGFMLGYFANNQITGIAFMKFATLPLIGIIIASMFVSDNWQWVFYPFPNYLIFRLIKDIVFNEYEMYYAKLGFTIIVHIIYLSIFLPFMKRKFKLS